MVNKKGNIIRGVKTNIKFSRKKCTFGVNKNSGKCLKHPRRKK